MLRCSALAPFQQLASVASSQAGTIAAPMPGRVRIVEQPDRSAAASSAADEAAMPAVLAR